MKTMFILLIAALSHFSVQAGVIIGGTRLVYNGAQKEATITVKNPDDIPYLVQSWANTKVEGSEKAPFLITPPLFRLDGKQENTLRVMRVAGQLPEDKESLFWLSVKSVPPSEGKGNQLQIAVRTRIKLIYRPAGLKGSLDDAARALRWQRSGNTLMAMNDSPYYLSFYSVSLANEKIKEPQMVAPGASISYSLPANASGNLVNWQIINDFGGISEVYQHAL
ncbi:long polar fimbrial chaperone LpfB [Chania multitudinisentens RB-25]|uniref:Long polar fimbrial chaperone LpfB n=1 Tax=Chania multitudinisentens RB-25 TaxID=1441930 RepID=W0L889_9GAMM|nr:molecular chaperone [Chania multitudinisentens]AHG20033.1 long polar fimbrial chaperone LpfB [Chania multitudinisentens RB-25]